MFLVTFVQDARTSRIKLAKTKKHHRKNKKLKLKLANKNVADEFNRDIMEDLQDIYAISQVNRNLSQCG